jgi:hypothetical protein
MAQPINYVAKHPFQGDVRQSQLTFPKGATLVAKTGQDGSWWWGSFQGKEGWFPPAYVAPMGPAAPPQVAYGNQQQQQQQQMSMQQRMQQASFAPSVKQQQQQQQQQQQRPAGIIPQQQQPYLGGFQQQTGFATTPQPGFQQPGFGSAPVAHPQQTYASSDPFAGLQSMNAGPTNMSSNVSLGSTGSGSAANSTMSAGMNTNAFRGGPGVQQPSMQKPAAPAATQKPAVPSPTAMNSTQEAFARMGVKPLTTPTSGGTPRSQTPQSSDFTRAAPGRAKSAHSPALQGAQSGLAPEAASAQMRNRSLSPSRAEPIVSMDKVSSPPERRTTASPASKTPEKSFMPATDPTKSKTPQPLSKEEVEAKRLREQEETRLKAKMRKEKEELARQTQEKETAGIGSSGVALQTTDSGEVEIAMPGQESGFNAYDFLAGTTGGLPSRKFSPIFRVPPFWGMMNLVTYVRRSKLAPDKLADRAGAYQQLAKALSFVCHVVAESEEATKTGRGRFATFRSQEKGKERGPLASLRYNHLGCEACVKLISILPHSAGASGKALDGLFINFINVFVSLVENLQPNQQIVVPGGWQQPDYFHLCLYIVRNTGDNRWSFTVCNTGKDGLQYHPATFDSETGQQLKQLGMTVWNIPAQRLLDATFWTLLFRMQVYPSKRNSAEFLYTKLLPALNSQPLRSNLDQGPADYHEIPNSIEASTYHPLAKLAMTTTPQMGKRSSKYTSLLLMNAAVDLAYAEIENAPPSSMDPEDTRILKLTGRNLSNFASTLDPMTVGDGTLGASLASTWDLLDKLHKKINATASKPMDLSQSALSDDFSKGHILSLRTDAGSAAHPLFGRLRRDDYENVVKNLMGDPRPDPILIPAVLTDEELPPIATDYATAGSSLQRIADACSLLLQQRRLIKNASAFAASASQYAMTVILPMPNADPKYCFWRKSDMKRETQLNLLFLLRRICRIYQAATTCIQQSRGLITVRSIAFAKAACVADAICRVKAVDDPSAFALHYSGLCEGPTEPFAIEAGSFDTLGSNLPIYDPNLCSLRFRCLDYLRDMTLKMNGTKRNTIFNFDTHLLPTEGDVVITNQLSIQLALVRPYPATDEAMMNHAANLISGRNGSIIEVLPEFEYFRDIVFHFKHAVSGKSAVPESATENKAWLPSDSTLHWKVKKRDKEDPRLYYHVTAFQDHSQEFVERVAMEPTNETAFKGFMSLFASKSKVSRSRLSSADPNTVVNSCGDKFLSKR